MSLRPGSVIDNKQSLLEILEKNGEIYVKKTAKRGGEADVIAQVRMLRSLPGHLKPHYPLLLEWEIETPPYWYSMSFYNFPTLREHVFFGDAPRDILQRTLSEVITFLFYKQYEWKKERADIDYLQRAYIERMHKRLNAMTKADNEFKRFLSVDRIILDGQILASPVKLLDRITLNKSLFKALQPEYLFSIHGQMEFDHILLDIDNNSLSSFILLDPRGVETLGDSAYDLGKIWQSVNTMIDLVEEDLYELKFSIHDDALIIDEFNLMDSKVKTTCRFLYKSVREQITKIMKEKNDPNLVMRSDFAEAIHLCSAIPFYYEGDEKLRRALACYILGALSLNRFIDNY